MTTPATTPAAPTPPSATAPSAAPSSPASPSGGGGAAGGGTAQPAAAPAATPAPDQSFARLQIQLRNEKKAREAAEARVAALSPLESQLAEIKDPEKRYAALERMGVKYEQWTEELLRSAGATTETPRNQLPAEVQRALERLDGVEAELAEAKKAKAAEAENETKAQQTARLENGRAMAAKLLLDGGEKYEIAHAFDMGAAVVSEYIARTERDGVEPDEQEVCAYVEQQLEQRIAGQLETLTKTKKGKALLAKLLGAAPAQNGAQASPRAQMGQPSGLTNGLSAETGDGVNLSKLSKAELRSRALEKAKASRAS